MVATNLRRVTVAALAALALLSAAGVVRAHPLGNYTVNRSIGVRIAANEIAVRYVIDMAEIPAFTELQLIDGDADGQTDLAELSAYASAACAGVRSSLRLEVDASTVTLQPEGDPRLSFPAGAGGLATLRLVCAFVAPVFGGGGEHAIMVFDRIDDDHVGWREVTISGQAGVAIDASDVPSVSTSAELTRYPADALQTPPDVRSGWAQFHRTSGGSGAAMGDTPAPKERTTSDDPLAALVGGELTPAAAIGALLLALLLGAGHALSPGHGKTLVAAYLIGTRGSVRHAATLGLTVAVTHTAGVFLLAAVTLVIGQFFVPERVIEWLSIASGALVAMLGAGLVFRALRGTPQPDHAHPHPHPHPHAHPHSQAEPRGPDLRRRNVIALGLAGGMVPSASALIVFLVAITTGRLLFGMVLIGAFGAGMAVVLGGLAVLTTVLRGSLRAPTRLGSHRWARLAVASLPLASGIAVLVAGLSVSIGALVQFA